jgi:hypothetical protein
VKKLRIGRPSPATIIAVIALIAALGGTAVAGGVLTNKQFTKKALRGPVTYVKATVAVPVGPLASTPIASATCPPNTHVIGGGAEVSRADTNAFIDDSYPVGDTGWAAKFDNTGATAYIGTVTAICAKVKRTET